jgi:hypothetical protein
VSGFVGRLVPRLGRVEAERDEARREADFLQGKFDQSRQRVAELKSALAKSRKKVGASKLVIDELRSEVATYQGPWPGGGQPDRLGYLFVMTYGSSGSTLLQAVLNSIPGFLIRGENGGIVPHLYQFHHGALATKTELTYLADWPGHPQFGMNDYPDGSALNQIRRLVAGTLLRPTTDTRVVGFKEIQWCMDYLPEYVAFLRELFPGARFIVNTREVTDTAGTRWWGDDEDAAQTIAAIEDRIFEVARALGDDCFHISYDDYAADPEELRPLFAWLNEDFDRARIDEVMAIRYSS